MGVETVNHLQVLSQLSHVSVEELEKEARKKRKELLKEAQLKVPVDAAAGAIHRVATEVEEKFSQAPSTAEKPVMDYRNLNPSSTQSSKKSWSRDHKINIQR